MISKTMSPYKDYGIEEEVRLVVYDSASKKYIHKKIINIHEVYQLNIDSHYLESNLKFKYQVHGGDRWKDILGGNQNLFRVDAKKLLGNINFIKTHSLDIDSLRYARSTDLSYALKSMLKSIYEYLFASPLIEKISKTKAFLQLFTEDIIVYDDAIVHFHSELSILVEYIAYYESGIDVSNKLSNSSKLQNILDAYKFNYLNCLGVKTGKLAASGNISSLNNRELAYKNYQEALSIGNTYINCFLAVDAMTTYYENIPKENSSYCIEEHELNKFNENLNVCFSTDPNYLRMFAPIWIQASFYFTELNFNFGIVVSSKEEFSKIVNSYEKLVKGYSDFMDMPIPNNNRFFWISCNIINKTLYACARFYLSSLLLKNYPSDVYISDIDQLVIGDLESYLKKISLNKLDKSVYLPIASNYFRFLPGRSHLAGNIFIFNDSEGKKFSNILTNYVGLGIEEKFS